ncbi:hypothetical protein C8F04DRAFT_1367968 [Mycena alexandri]|uniref:Uncharacterized protein n=1 Tax=Mycena alexandri TaxID=1745969 RepID=A0AAD6SM35_9AGAR|nr:hypothetical protein C8F04DRAFT_1367968 [Mycena alexandri]
MERRVVACSRMLETARASVEVGPPHITQGSEPCADVECSPTFPSPFEPGANRKRGRLGVFPLAFLSLSFFFLAVLGGAYPYLWRRVGHGFVHGYSPADFPWSPPPPLSRAGSTRPPSSVGTKMWMRRGGGEGRGGGAETYTVSRVRCLPPGAGSENGRHAHCSTGGGNAGARGAMACTPLHARSFTFTPRRRRLRLDAAGLGKVRNEDKMGRRYARESTGLFEAPLSRVRCTVCYTGALLSVSREDLGEEGKETLLEFAPDFSSY